MLSLKSQRNKFWQSTNGKIYIQELGISTQVCFICKFLLGFFLFTHNMEWKQDAIKKKKK